MRRREFLAGIAGVAGTATARLARGLKSGLESGLAVSGLAESGLVPVSSAANALAARLARDPLRPQYHLLPVANWMNDPNGPIRWRGEYHMFYQYNPDGAYWGDMHWGHAVSPDMVRWRQLPVALAPTPGGADGAGVFSGTAAVVEGRVWMMYTGVRAVPEAEATIRNGAQSLLETQCLAVSEDDGLRQWRKRSEPVIAAPPQGMAVNGFRDPSPWRMGDAWYAVLGTGTRECGGAVLLYRSPDLRRWEFLHVLAERAGSVAVPLEKPDANEVWECPEFFALGEESARRHVLIYSTNGRSYWMCGRLDEATMRFAPEQAGALDFGAYYAAKTQLDAAGRRILWGWIPETRPEAAYKAAGWAGAMALPRVLTLDGQGRLRMQVAEAVETLRGAEKRWRPGMDGSALERQLAGIAGYCGELHCAASGEKAWELELDAADGQDAPMRWLRVGFSPQMLGEKTLGQTTLGEIRVNGQRIPLSAANAASAAGGGRSVDLRVWVDGSVVEVVVNGEAACTLRLYPDGERARVLRPRWSGDAASLLGLSVWPMTAISPDRLTS